MSGLVKSIGKSFKRLSKSKVARGILIAAAIYYLGGMASNAMGNPDGAQLSATGDASVGIPADGEALPTGPPPDSWSAGDAVDTGADVTAGLEPPAPAAPAQVQAPTVAAPAPTQPEQPAAVPAPASTPAPVADRSTTLGKPGDASGNQGAWFKGLSPGAQAIIAGGVMGGAGATMQALGTKSAQEDARAREDRARADKIRRGSIQPYAPGAFRQRGLIDGSIG